MRSKAEIEIEFKNNEEALAAIAAMKHEGEFKKRSDSKTAAEGNVLKININSSDLVSLRASVNSYLRNLQVIEGIKNSDED